MNAAQAKDTHRALTALQGACESLDKIRTARTAAERVGHFWDANDFARSAAGFMARVEDTHVGEAAIALLESMSHARAAAVATASGDFAAMALSQFEFATALTEAETALRAVSETWENRDPRTLAEVMNSIVADD